MHSVLLNQQTIQCPGVLDALYITEPANYTECPGVLDALCITEPTNSMN